LEDGVFTDSLGRDYELNKYIIIFTANLPKEKIPEKLSPELLSRFNLKYSFSNLSLNEKMDYVNSKVSKIVNDIQTKLNIEIDTESLNNITDIDIKKYDNMRDINSEIMKKIGEILYPILFED
jgi:ATP-dependent Clp protease ATP-binding subunit ClpA